VNNQLNIKRQITEPLRITKTENTTKLNSYSESKVDRLAQLKLQRSRKLQSLKETAVDLARLEMQVKKITATDTIINSCDQCVGKYLNLCGRCMLYIGEHIKKHPNSSKDAQKSQSDIVFFDEGQEDAYWL
jgi:hypothetical protein